ncbi:host specificity factor TipJ family phage tail protein [Geobacter sp.]|uniref:host specificity factor TipJ family phage tail protein n=1 Tax=Geobacter sp. TaxID=46610 RepID=UPI002614D59C|nr:host specificity factor TipJ family phage tail protein [Geobacter sp.]
MERLQLITIKNPFDRRDRDISTVTVRRCLPLAELVRQHIPADLPVVVSLNGRMVPRNEWVVTYPAAGDQIVIMPEVQGGDTGKSILRAVIVIVATVVGAVLGQYYLGPLIGSMMGGAVSAATAGTIGAAIGAGIGGMIGGFVANAVLPPPKATIPSIDSAGYDTSATYAWNPQNTQQQGLVIPRWYGTNRLYGNIIASYLESDGEKQYLNVLISLGMGPYKRLYDFQINDQPVDNLKGVEIHTRLGHLDQTPMIPNFNDTKTEYAVGVKIVNDSPYVYTTVGSSFDGLEVDVTFPQGLWYANDQGGLSPVSVDVRIEVKRQGDATWKALTSQVIQTQQQVLTGRWSAGCWVSDDSSLVPAVWLSLADGGSDPQAHYDGEPYPPPDEGYYGEYGPYWRWITETVTETVSQTVDYVTITGSKTAAIRRTFKVGGLSAGRYDIRITNLTADQTTTRYGDDMYLTAVREVLSDDFEYPRQVLVGIRALATDQLSGSLRFSCMADCALVRIWDGAAWTVDVSDDPAWVTWDQFTQPVFDNNLNVVRYDGMDPARLDLAKWKEWRDYTATLVPDGAGGQEKRITFNGGFDSEYSLWDAVMQVCQMGRAVPIWNGIHLTLAIDKPSAAVQLFTVGNIEIDSFEETFLPMADRASEIEIDFINSEKGPVRDKLTVIDPTSSNKTNRVSLQLIGCNKPSQAWRAGQYRLNCNKLLTRLVRWGVDIDAIACTVGDVVRVQHDVPQWGEGGRLVAASTNTVTLDKEITLAAGKSYSVMVRLSDDTVVERGIANSAGTYDTLTVSAPFSTVPQPYDVYTFGEVGKVVKELRLVGVEPAGDLKRILVGTDYNESIDAADYGEPVIPTVNVSALDVMPAVTDLHLEERLVKSPDGVINTLLAVSWKIPAASTYGKAEVWYDVGGGWVYAGDSPLGELIVPVLELRTYTVAVRTVNTVGQKMPLQNAPRATITTLGKQAPPADVAGFGVEIVRGQMRLFWDAVADADLAGYEIQMGTLGSVWDAVGTTVVITGYTGTTLYLPVSGAGRFDFLIKAIDTTRHYSANASSTSIDVTVPRAIVHIYMGEDLYTTNVPSVVKSRAKFTWDEVDSDIEYYEIEQWGPADTGWVPLGQVGGAAYTVEDTKPGTLQFRVRGVNASRLPGPWTATSVMLEGKTAPPNPPAAIAAQIVDNLVKITITPSADLDLASHSIRVGASWADGVDIGTISHPQNTFLWRPTTSGNLQFWVKSTDTSNIESLIASGSPVVVVSPPNFAPGAVITPQVIDNNVLLKWPEAVGSYPVDVYEVRRGLDFATAQIIGQIRGTFTTIFETAAGTYKYWVTAIDTAELLSMGPLSVYATVNQPPDFVLRDQRPLNWAAGTKTNCVVDADGSLVVPVNATETFQDHFASRSWTSPQDQVTAGYSVFVQPGMTSGQYVEVIDYGTTIPSSKITLDLTRVTAAGTVTLIPKLSLSTDGSTWTDYAEVYQAYAGNFRYVKVTLDFATSDGGVMCISNSLLRLDLKKKTISIAVNLPSTTGDGDQINFADYGVTFIDVEAIAPGAPFLNNTSLDPVRVIANFVDVPNPTYFKGLAYDKNGNRIALTGSNKANFIISGV